MKSMNSALQPRGKPDEPSTAACNVRVAEREDINEPLHGARMGLLACAGFEGFTEAVKSQIE
jgi:hypothetical protein